MESHPTLFAFVALFAWLPLILAMFALMPPRKAVIYGFIVAWLFLPMVHIPLHGLTDYNKMSAACFGVLLSAMIFDSGTLFAFRPRWTDLPMVLWCTCSFFSSYHNNLGAYDGFAAIAYQTTDWGLPYLIGRLYFNDLKGLRELAMGIVVGGLVYMPLCLFEIRFSPVLHIWLYGFLQHTFQQSVRYGRYRPMVFMQHGLAVGMWMSAATLVAYWLWRTKTVERILQLSLGTIVLGIGLTTIACRSVGSVILLAIGIAVLELTKWLRAPFFILMLAAIPPMYMFARTTGIMTGDTLVQYVNRIDSDKGGSLDTRFFSENVYVAKALKSPLFGWGGWNRSHTYNDQGREVGIPDALWIIAFGEHGIVGLSSLTLAVLMPLLVLWRRIPVKYWALPSVVPAAVLAVLLGLHMLDNLMNAMINPIFMLAAGGIVGLSVYARGPVTASQSGQMSAPSLGVHVPGFS